MISWNGHFRYEFLFMQMTLEFCTADYFASQIIDQRPPCSPSLHYRVGHTMCVLSNIGQQSKDGGHRKIIRKNCWCHVVGTDWALILDLSINATQNPPLNIWTGHFPLFVMINNNKCNHLLTHFDSSVICEIIARST